MYSQEIININGYPCGIHGSARSQLSYYLDSFKNRFQIPMDSDFDNAITFQDLCNSADPNQFSSSTAVHIIGYVFNVKMGGA